MIVIDTSVWIEYFRNKHSPIVSQLNDVLDLDKAAITCMTWIEILSGAKRTEIGQLRRVLSALPKYLPADQTWGRIEDWISIGLEKGHRFGAADLLIASIAVENKATLWSLDSDFKRMEKLGFIELYSV
jgi:predicted nucleic acid-binding protein